MTPTLLRRLALLVICGAAFTPAFSQEAPIKFGKIDERDLTGANFVADSAAAAVILCDYGRSHFEYIDGDFRILFERVTRIKILKKSGYDWATVKVPLYHKERNAEKLTGLKGFTYNLVDGHMVKEKLPTEAIFRDEATANVTVRKFTLPNVRVGSIIEYSYLVTSDFLFNFQDWQFQHEIPVRWSEYQATIPKYFDYKTLMQGYDALALNEHTEGVMQAALRESGGTSGSGFATQRVAGSTTMVQVPTKIHRWVMKDVPAFRDEPYMTSYKDYVDRIDFELAGIRWEGQPYQPVSNTWVQIDRELLTDDNFGAQLKRGSFMKDQLTPLLAKETDPAARVAAIHALVRKSVKYNGTDRLYTAGTLRHAYDVHTGSAADVNLLLIATLREAGLTANPVMLSTRDNGMINTDLPLVSKFNYVIAHVSLPDGKEMLVDATEELLPCGTLPQRCLSRTGRLVMPNPEESRWVDLKPTQRYLEYRQIQLTVDERGGITGKVHQEHGGYSAQHERELLQKQGEKKYIEQLASAHEGWSIPKFAFKEREQLPKPLTLDYEFASAGADGPTSTIYLSPLRSFSDEKNPFRHEERLFPVDFGAQVDETVMMTITLPAGFVAEELPKSALVDLPEDGGRYSYTIVPGENAIQIVSRMSLRKPFYSAEEYAYLREFYNRMLAKQAEQIVLKKKS
ncbi:transglutaminase domain-containing protein [Hymenobacter algoricola]|uniref:Transglutaminase-like domain-containing protein n=1 Tax=Hymenobacter algoricola TaxID=486267 RepID=A0ABP7NNW0_9BACT